MVDRAFASCQGPCKLAAVGGFVGSDLFNLWENAIKSAGAKYPNVSIVADITYAIENTSGNVETVFASFQTVPEPTSLVLVASGALSILAFALARARQRG